MDMSNSSRCLLRPGPLSHSLKLKFTATPLLSLTQTRCKTFKPRMISMEEKAKLAERAKLQIIQVNPAHIAKREKEKATKKRKVKSPLFKSYDLKDAERFSLCDAIRYIRAFEVGEDLKGAKFDVHLKLRTTRDGPKVRNRLRLPYPVKTQGRVAVICPPDSMYASEAMAAGASLVGEESIFEAVKDGKIEFDSCICQLDSVDKMSKSGIARILGPKGLMPSIKMKTVTKDPSGLIRQMIGGADYRERLGVVRMVVGQLGFTPEELAKNIKAFIDSVKKDIGKITEKTTKDLHEVVLSASHSPGFSLNGQFRDPESSISPRDLSTS